MTRATTLTVATVMSVAALAVAGQTASAAAAPSEAPSPGTAIPADFVTLIDDTGTITVDVPSSWTDIDTTPFDGIPYIEAMPDMEAYLDYDAPGVTYRAWAFTDDTATEVDGGWELSCATQDVQPYDDGVFVGSHFIYSHCGDIGTAEHHVIIANPANGAFTAFLDIQITGPDEQPILQHILDTFNAAPGDQAVAPSAPSTTVASAAPTDAFAPSGAIPDGWTALVDDTQTLSLSVPAVWTAIRVAPLQHDNGTTPTIAAATDPTAFYGPDLSVPGVIYGALPRDDVTASLLDPSEHPECTPGAVQPYDDGVFVGYIGSYDGCGGTATRIVEVFANPAEGVDFTAYLSIQLTGAADDTATLDGLLSSFNWLSDPAPTGSAPAATPTVGGATGPQSIDETRQMVEDQFGVTITDEQGQCIIDTAPGVDPTFADGAVLLAVALTCGVSPIPGGERP